MKTAICTLFEGHYHFGLAALLNSLYDNNFEGVVYAGYRGDLPHWALSGSIDQEIEGYGLCKKLTMGASMDVVFLKLDTDFHFTNFKPDLMIDLWNGPAESAENMVYMDPDIVVVMDWQMFEDWFEHGVALCEDINSPVHENHPKRSAWRKYFKKYGKELKAKGIYYVNGGFVGLKKEYRSFAEDWKDLQSEMAESIGGLNRSSLTGQKLAKENTGIFAPFSKTDQDALNATVEYNDNPVSILGKKAMNFEPGKALLPHALGTPKPWMNRPILKWFRGYRPRLIDKMYWYYANGYIKSKPRLTVSYMYSFTRIAAFLSRFYTRL